MLLFNQNKVKKFIFYEAKVKYVVILWNKGMNCCYFMTPREKMLLFNETKLKKYIFHEIKVKYVVILWNKGIKFCYFMTPR